MNLRSGHERRMDRWGPVWGWIGMLLFSLIYFLVFFTLQWMKLGNYDVTNHDVINLFYMWGELADWSRGDIAYPNIGGLLSAPFYTIILIGLAIKQTMVWTILYTILPVSAAVFVYYILSRTVLKNTLWAVLFTLSLAFHPIVNLVSIMGLRGAPLFMFLFFLEIYFLRVKKPRAFLLCLILANLTRINASMINLLLGIGLLVTGKRRAGLTAMGISLLTAFLITGSILLIGYWTGETFTTEMIHLDIYGENLSDVLKNIILKPKIFLENLLIKENARHLTILFPVLFLPFLAPLFFLPCVVDLCFALFTTRSYMDSLWMENLVTALGIKAIYHNNMSFVMPVVYVSALLGLERVLKWIKGNRRISSLIAVCFVLVNVSYHDEFSSLFGGPLPLTKEFNLDYYRKSKHAEFIDRAWGEVPDGSRVKVKENLIGRQVCRMEKVFHLHFPFSDEDYDFVMADLYSFSYMFDRKEYIEEIKRTLNRDHLGVLFFQDGVILMKKGGRNKRNEEVIRFIENNRSVLEKNLFNPYVFGGAKKKKPGRVYSVTQYLENDS